MDMIKKVIIIGMASISFAAFGGQLKAEEKSVLANDSRNTSVDFNLFKSGKDLRFCVNNLSGEGSAMDVFRILLQTADLLKENNYEKVELCFRNKTKFVLGGDDFKVIGEEFGEQNPMYTIRTFPEKLTLLDGTKAYETHNGGALYLMRVQMADFQDMNGNWFMNDLVSEMKAEKEAKRPKEFAPDEDVF
ncbi:hypothetical protein RA805_003669 [Vibrio cholerae]|uniref:hypothetical protein n=1 Tax=Vibrio cholerae TaxID=666 RepID=UPI0011F1FB41|nr:hypothetical protein [Vibrio cholerae]ELF6478356.1 hypothetical protein [Vibrio cholerae]QEO43578.1 hypothetical protein F0316_18675 [Vibrio cholerae]